jgi:hypothetical protein
LFNATRTLRPRSDIRGPCLRLSHRNLWLKARARFSTDITYGLCDRITDTVGPQAVPLRAGRTRSSSGSGQLRHPAASDEMGTWCLSEKLRQLDDGVSMICAYMHSRGELLFYCCPDFSATFMDADEMHAQFHKEAVLPTLLLAK